MKKALITLSVILSITFFMIGADFRPASQEVVKKHCVGYTVVEAGLGIDCYGDTVRLIKKQGFYELASRYEGGAGDVN